MAANDGGSAFPNTGLAHHAHEEGGRIYWEEPRLSVAGGMTLRDWFAGQAISGLLAYHDRGGVDWPIDPVTWAYKIADALLTAREAPGDET